MDTKQTLAFVQDEWKASILQSLQEYIAIPNQSPLFDKEWETNGLIDKAAALLLNWVKEQKVPGLKVQLLKEPARTPLIFIEVPGTNGTEETVLMYGHLDKQPPMTADWEPGTGPATPVIKDGKLYGRGGADDGYAVFAAISAIKAVHDQNQPHARCVIVIEACEESGSPDLPFYINKLLPEIGQPSLVICLDSGCGNYEQLWLTTSLRGLAVANLEVKMLKEGVHSGAASGIVPSTFRILRQLLSRIEDEDTGKMIDELYCEIPPKQIQYTKDYVETVGAGAFQEFPFLPGTKPMNDDLLELVLNRNWRPTLSITGIAGLPPLDSAGNVLRTYTTAKLSIRLPPLLNPQQAVQAVKDKVETNPPYGAHVKCTFEKASKGWTAPELDAWLEDSLQAASNRFYNKPFRVMGEGGSIPFMGMLSEKFPGTQFVITGVLGPKSNAHGPNEFLHIDMTQKLTCCVASILVDHYKHKHPGSATKRRKMNSDDEAMATEQ